MRRDESWSRRRTSGDRRGRSGDPGRGRHRRGCGRRHVPRLVRRRDRVQRPPRRLPRDRLRRLARPEPGRVRGRAVRARRPPRDSGRLRRGDRRLLDRRRRRAPFPGCPPRSASSGSGSAGFPGGGSSSPRSSSRAAGVAAPRDARALAGHARRRLLARARARALRPRRPHAADRRAARAARARPDARGARRGGCRERLSRLARRGASAHRRRRLHRRRPPRLLARAGRDPVLVGFHGHRVATRGGLSGVPELLPRFPRLAGLPASDRVLELVATLETPETRRRAHDEHGRRRRARPRLRPHPFARRRRRASGCRASTSSSTTSSASRTSRSATRSRETTSRAAWLPASHSTTRASRSRSARPAPPA